MRGLREFQGVPDRLPGIRNTRFQTKSTGIEVPQLACASTFSRLQVSNTCLGTLILGRLRRLGRGFAQTFPHVAMFFDEPFDGFGAHLLVGVLREPVHHLLQVFGMLLQVLVSLVLLLSREARGTSRPGVVVQADQSGIVPALKPGRHGVSRDLIDVGNVAQRKALMAQQDTMGAHASASGRMQAMHVGQGLDFWVAERGHKFHRRLISARKVEGVRSP